jgi:hypothetical protein
MRRWKLRRRLVWRSALGALLLAAALIVVAQAPARAPAPSTPDAGRTCSHWLSGWVNRCE